MQYSNAPLGPRFISSMTSASEMSSRMSAATG